LEGNDVTHHDNKSSGEKMNGFNSNKNNQSKFNGANENTFKHCRNKQKMNC